MSAEREQGKRKERPEQATASWPGRTTAERVTMVVSLLVVLVVVGLLVYDFAITGDTPPLIAVEVDHAAVQQEEGGYYLPVTVTNRGEQTAEDVTIHFVLEREDGRSESTSLTFRFLAPGERSEGTLIFNADPTAGNLTYTSNYLRP